MEELTIEQKAQRYNEALEKAKALYGSSEPMSGCSVILEIIFPELKESEDDKVEKAIFGMVYDSDNELWSSYDVTKSDVIAWLEKQGEKSVDKLQVSGELYEHIRNTCACIDDALSSETLADINDYLSMAEHSAQSAFDMIEKQGEQNPYSGVSFKYNGHTWGMCARDNGVEILVDGEIKERVFLDNKPQGKSAPEATKEEKVYDRNCVKPANKVEPKFKVGDWLIFNEHHNRVYQVERIDNYRYYLRHYLGGTMSVHFDNELIRLWTIQDARDGDVLISKYGSMCIFKDNKSCYCYIDTKHETFYAKNNRWFSTDYTLKPATKEQRDLLFHKMKEAGYEWDARNKVMTKIEQKPADSYCQENCKGFQETGKCFADGECKAKREAEQKSAWSEEDEDNFKHLLDEIVCLGNNRNSANRLYYDKLIKFIEELKNRTQPKEKWCDKDERMLDRLIAYFEKQVALTDDDNPRYANWLKSLRPQNRWKPSDEQMESLDWQLLNTTEGSWAYKATKELIEDLKKLKEV